MPSLDQPLAKRQKLTFDQNVESTQRASGSKIFYPFRLEDQSIDLAQLKTLGLVSPTTVPFTCVRLGKSTFQITTSVGNSLQTYDLRRGLNLVFVSRPQTPETITAVHSWKDKVFAAWGNFRPGSPGGIWVFKRGKRVASLEVPTGLAGPIERLLVFGSWIVGCSNSSIEVWKSSSYDHYTSLTPQRTGGHNGEHIYTGEMCNMPTYLNKIFVGRYDGAVDIWNLRTGKLIYSILPAFKNAGPITAVQATPVLSLIAIAYKSGAISIQDVETDKVVIPLRTPSSKASPVTSIAFRTDGLGAGEDGRIPGVMATACIDNGDITMWDLNNGGRVTGILRRAHKLSGSKTGSGTTHLEFLDGQPVFVSSGKDNALKTWIFDETPFSPIPRPLHQRSGHSAAVTALDFLPSSSDGSEFGGKWLLSASKDCSLWGFSVRKDSQNTEISQGAVEHKANKAIGPVNGSSPNKGYNDYKAPEITCIACALNRDGGMGTTTTGPIWANPKVTDTNASNTTGWESVVTGHRGDKYARTWFWGKKKAGRWTFETGDGTEIKSVAISQCGTFAFVGSAGGSIKMFNLQSGRLHQSFPTLPLRSQIQASSKGHGKAPFAVDNSETKHTKAVTGLMVDGLNQTVISCGLDGKVKFWEFVSGRLVGELNWHPMTAITGIRYNSSSELAAFSCDDLSIRVVDIETRKVVREFWGCVGQVNDFTFSNDGRWIIAASADSIVRVWDLPTGHLIDAFRVPSTCTALTMSSTGEYLATAHADDVGISLWTNRSLFMPVSTKNMDEDHIRDIKAPTASGEGGVGLVEAAFTEDYEYDETDGPMLSTEQISKEMVTLSLVPKSKWQTLLHLDSIKERNKPLEPPKAPEKAPFFLPSLPDGATSGKDADSTETTATEYSRVAKIQQSNSLSGAGSRFSEFLRIGRRSGNFEPCIEYMESLSPTKLDLDIRSLNVHVQDGHSELSDFVAALRSRLQQRKDFELANAWMAVFLRVHAETVSACSSHHAGEQAVLREALVNWSREQQREANRLATLVGYCRGVIGFLRSSR